MLSSSIERNSAISAGTQIRSSGILIAPRTARMKSQHGSGDIVGEIEAARAQILFRECTAWVACFVPNFSCALDPN